MSAFYQLHCAITNIVKYWVMGSLFFVWGNLLQLHNVKAENKSPNSTGKQKHTPKVFKKSPSRLGFIPNPRHPNASWVLGFFLGGPNTKAQHMFGVLGVWDLKLPWQQRCDMMLDFKPFNIWSCVFSTEQWTKTAPSFLGYTGDYTTYPVMWRIIS